MRVAVQLTVLSALVSAAVGFPPRHAMAQATPGGGVESFMASSFRRGLVARALESIPPIVLRKCPAMRAPGSSLLMIKPLVFAPDGYPTAGIWKERLPITGCGADVTINVIFTATPDEKVNAIVELPGSTKADPILQRDARNMAIIRASVVAKTCNAFDVTNTTFRGLGASDAPAGMPKDNAPLRAWWETWTLVGCGHVFDVPMDFVRDATGTLMPQRSSVSVR